MKISTRSKYGLRAITYLAKVYQKGKVFPLKEIAKEESIPFDYLEKIMAELKKAKLVKAKKGAHGGYYLAKKPKKIRVGEVIKTLEGNLIPVECLSDKKCPLEDKCLTKKFWKKMKKLLKPLNKVTLADLVNHV